MNIKFMLREIKSIKFKELNKSIQKIKKQINKKTIYIYFDLFKCINKYGTSYKEYFLYEFYLLDEDSRATYLTKRIEEEIVDKYNNKEEYYKFNDRINFNNCFKKYIKRDFIDLRSVSFKEFKNFITDKEKIVAKTIKNGGLVEVINLDYDKLKNEYYVLKIYNSIMKKEEFLIEEYIDNSKENISFKIITFLDELKEVHILNSIIWLEDKKAFSIINENGKLITPFLSEDMKVVNESNNDINGYKNIVNFVKELAKEVKEIRYTEWNVILKENDVFLINGYVNPKIYQIPKSLSGNNEGILVKYKKYMEI